MGRVTVSGLAELQRNLDKIAKELTSERSAGIVGTALRKGLESTRDAAVNNAPVDTGKMRSGIAIRMSKKPPGNVAAEVGIIWESREKVRASEKYPITKGGKKRPLRSYGDRYYAMFVEFGAPARGIAPNPFMRRAFEGTKYQALIDFRASLRESVKMALEELAVKVKK